MKRLAINHPLLAHIRRPSHQRVRSRLRNSLLLAAIAFSVIGFSPAALALLAYGDQGADVSALQRALISAGYRYSDVDGIFGSQTQQAVTEFQRANGLSVDGVAGPQTLGALGLSSSLGGGGSSGGISGGISGGCGYSFSGEGEYIVAVPGTDIAQVRNIAGQACQDYSERGPFINVGSFSDRARADDLASRLRGFGFTNTQVYFRN